MLVYIMVFGMQVPEKKKKMIEVQVIVKNVALCFFSHKFTAQTYK